MGTLSEMLTGLHQYFLDNFLDAIGFLLTVIGGGFALLQWRASIKNNRADYVEKLLSKVMDDEQILEFQRLTDYGKEWYNEEFHRSEDRHIPVIADRTLFTYNYICYLFDTKVINKSELEIFTYYMLALAHDDQLACYFLDLYQYSVSSGRKFPFEHYLTFCENSGCVSRAVREKKYFFYVLCIESQANQHDIEVRVPDEVRALHKLVGYRLYIRSVSRCEHCKCFEDGKCTAKQSVSDHLWLCADNPCPSFDFETSLWTE